MFKKFGILFAVLMVMVLIGAGYAFAAANTVEKSDAGYVASTISGYNITNVAYSIVTDDPTKVDTIAFEIAPIVTGDMPAKTVKINTAASAVWTTWSCSLAVVDLKNIATCTKSGGVLVDTIAKLDIYASSN